MRCHDLTDQEWACWEPLLPIHVKPTDKRIPGRSSAPCYSWPRLALSSTLGEGPLELLGGPQVADVIALRLDG